MQINFAAVSFMSEYFHNEAAENMVVLLAVESGTGRGDLTLLRRTGTR